MSSGEHPEHTPATPFNEMDATARAELVARFRGPVEEYDAERVDFWRSRSDAEHAQAMIELADFAAKVVIHTGYDKDPDDMFPGFPKAKATVPAEVSGD